MTDEQFANLVENSDIIKNYTIKEQKNKKVLEKIENFSNSLILSKKEENIKMDFKYFFDNTGYKTKNNCTYKILVKNNNQSSEKLLCNFVAFIDEEITIDDRVGIHKIFKIIGKHHKGYSLSSVDVCENDFSSMNWIIKNGEQDVF